MRRWSQRRTAGAVGTILLVLAVLGGGLGGAFAVRGESTARPAAVQPGLSGEQKAEIRAALEDALRATKSGRLREVAANVRRAAALAEASGQGSLASTIRLCRAGLCFVSQLSYRLGLALDELERIPTTETAGTVGLARTQSRSGV